MPAIEYDHFSRGEPDIDRFEAIVDISGSAEILDRREVSMDVLSTALNDNRPFHPSPNCKGSNRYMTGAPIGGMSVILEFSVPATEFQLGEVLSGSSMQIELERIVPTGDMVMPFVWATGDDHDAFAEMARSQPNVRELLALDRIGESGLYRIEWEEPPMDLIEGIATADGVVLEARGHDDWTFRLRLPDHDNLSTFHNYVIEHGIPVHIDRTYTLTEATGVGRRFGLSEEQREALLLALQHGYFETPSETSLDELADELGISRQALSNRIRRGNEKILREMLLSSGEKYE